MLTAFDYALICSFAFLILLYRFVRDWYGYRETPRKLEHEAAEFLQEQGYRIRALAVVKYLDFRIDERKHLQKVRADLVVTSGFKKYVVEVNARSGTSSVRNADIRRRILEYQIAFNPHGIISVDMDKGKLRTIVISNRRIVQHILAMATALCLGAVLYLLLR
ncbi:MAG: hypothetical protein FH749_05225 [Firmicutes bacterium]|nr:hypothetical protein [Bacillota bacterium]